MTGGAHPIRILIADDHAVVRKGVISYLARHEQLTVVAEAEDGVDAIKKAMELSPDVVLMDIDMPKLNGLAATEVLHREQPRMKILVLSVYTSEREDQRLLKAGASGCLSKQASLGELVQAIETVSTGGDFFKSTRSEGGTNEAAPRELSVEEREVLVAIVEGLKNKDIATKLATEVRSIETCRERIMRKLNIRSVADLTRFAIIEGLVSLPGL